jgi:nitroreductase
MDQLELQKQAVLTTRRCQRNWDRTKKIPQSHIDHWTFLATNSPSKQDEARFGLCVITKPEVLDIIYDDFAWGSHRFGNDAGRNTQMGSNALFIFSEVDCSDNENDSRGIPQDPDIVVSGFEKRTSLNFNRDIGLAMGIVCFSAAQMGYKTGFNTNLYFNKHTPDDWKKLLGIPINQIWRPTVALCIGYPDETLKWYQSRDKEYLEADPREPDLENNTTLNHYKGVRKEWVSQLPLREFGPVSHDNNGDPKPKDIPLVVIQ